MPFTAPSPVDGNAFSNVVAGGKATVEIPTDGVYYSMTIEYRRAGTLATKAQMITDISEIRLMVNGKPQHEYSAAEFFAWLELNGQTVTDGYVEIPFALPWRQEIKGQDFTRLGTLDVQTLHLEVKLDAGAVTPSLKLSYEKSLFNEPMGPILKFRKQHLGVTSTGLRNETNLPKNDKYLQMLLFEANQGDIGAVEIKLDQRSVYKESRDQNKARLSRWGFVDQAKVFPVIFDYRSRNFEFLDAWMLNNQGNRTAPHASFQFDMDMVAATNVKMLQVLIGPRD